MPGITAATGIIYQGSDQGHRWQLIISLRCGRFFWHICFALRKKSQQQPALQTRLKSKIKLDCVDTGNFQPDLLFDPFIVPFDFFVSFFGFDPFIPAALPLDLGSRGLGLGWRCCGYPVLTVAVLTRLADFCRFLGHALFAYFTRLALFARFFKFAGLALVASLTVLALITRFPEFTRFALIAGRSRTTLVGLVRLVALNRSSCGRLP